MVRRFPLQIFLLKLFVIRHFIIRISTLERLLKLEPPSTQMGGETQFRICKTDDVVHIHSHVGPALWVEQISFGLLLPLCVSLPVPVTLKFKENSCSVSYFFLLQR